MSVKRYQPVAQCVEPSYQAQMIVPKVMEFSEGEYVLHSDYARLKADAQVLLKHLDEASLDCARLKAEVERLRKAGDAMEVSLQADFNGCPYEPMVIREVIHKWRSAKEGKQP